MQLRKKIGISLAIGGSLLVAACASILPGDPDPRWENYREWTQAGPVTTGNPTGLTTSVHEGPSGYRLVYVNDTGAETLLGDGPYQYPVGTVVVKEQYASQKAYENKKKPGVTVSVKIADGTGVETWAFADGFTDKAGNNTFCSGCHTAALQDDFVFTNGAFLKKHGLQ